MEFAANRRPRYLLLWLLGNVLIVAGLLAILYIGGLQAYGAGQPGMYLESPATPIVRRAPALDLTPTPTPGLPVLNWDRLPQEPPPPTASPLWRSAVTQIRIPAIGLNESVIPVGWSIETINGQLITVWDVASYAVGHHRGSGNPGDGTNIVLAGHSGGLGAVFRRLPELQPGDEIILDGSGRQYLYVVEEILFLQEIGVPMEERLRNAQYMAPSDEERVTMITCWPVHIYDQRVIALARPYRASPFPRPDWVED